MITVTPQLAASFLEKNTRNRPLIQTHVRRLAKEMQEGRWRVNGDTIRFNGDTMIDGQHRCAASIKAGCSFQTLIVRGLDSDVFSTIDAGKGRSAGDTLSLMGITHGNAIAAALKFVERIATGRVTAGGKNAFTNSQVKALFVKYPGIVESVTMIPRKKCIFPVSVLAGLHYLFSIRDREAADKFVFDILHGIGLEEGDPVYVLRERLLQNSYTKQKLRPEFIAAYAIKAWNARRGGKKIAVLKYLENETFPLVAD